MNLKSLLALSAAAALSFSVVACDDDSNGDEQKDPEKSCSVKCDGNTAITCDKDGKEVKTPCGNDKTCNAGKCEAKSDNPSTPKCEQKCDGNTAITCNADGTENKVDCGATKTCKDGACEEKGNTEPEPAKCEQKCEANTAITCDNDGKEVKTPCGENQTCKAGVCEDNPAPVEPVANSLIGKACTCTGDACTFVVTGKEVAAAVPLATTLTDDKDQPLIPNDETVLITAPNFFSSSIQGCEGLVAPAGMAVGCLTTQDITFSDHMTNLVGSVKKILDIVTAIPGLGDKINLDGIDLDKIIPAVQDLLNKGISFKANNGYCIVADIDLKLNVTDPKIAAIVKMDEVNKIVDKVNTPGHDHAKAEAAACPEGSTKLSFGVDSTSDKGSANVGFDLCLKACKNDDDCRKEDGYSCIDMPANQAEVEAGTKSAKVCFDNANIEYFTKITEDFEGLFPKEDGESK